MAAKKAAASVVKPQDDYLRDLKRKFALSQDLCEPARTESNIDQDYYDGKQFTADEERVLKRRKQPITIFNEVKPGINGMIGIVERGKTDPRAYGRGKNDSDSAEVATDCLRYVADKNRFQNLRSQAMKDFFIPGICVAVVEIDDQREVVYKKGRYEAFFYDPYSREPDFSDARWLGLGNWMDEDDALTLPWVDSEEKKSFIKQSIDISEIGDVNMGGNQTTQDRPQGAWAWGDKIKRRVMVVQMWHKRGIDWHMCVFVSAGVLQEGPSEYKDDRGRPTCNLIAQSAYVDRDNKRYGAVRDMRGPQDAINKGWSKALHILNTAKLRVDPGVADIDDIRAEYAKPDGVIVAMDGKVAELGDRQLLPAHMEMLNLAEQKMRRQTPTPGIVGRNASSQSGKAILAEQQAGMTEQAPTLGSFDDWTLRIYRMTWACIKQYWDAPKYIRVTDDENAPKYVLLNQPEPVTDAKGQPVIDPATGQPKMRFVKPAEMDVDIIIDSTPDTASLQEDQYKGLLELATVGAQTQTGTIPFKAIIEASALPRKRQILDAMEQDAEEKAKQPQQPGPAEQEQAKAQVQLQANATKHQQDAAAHGDELARSAQEKQFEAELQQRLAEHGFTLKERALDNQHMRDNEARQADAALETHKFNLKKREMGIAHKQKRAQLRAQPAADGEQATGDGADDQAEPLQADEAMPIEPETQALMALAQAVAQMAQASLESSQAATQAMLKLAQAVSAPRQLVKGPNGEKMAVSVHNETMQ